MQDCQFYIQSGKQCSRAPKMGYEYCWQHIKKINNESVSKLAVYKVSKYFFFFKEIFNTLQLEFPKDLLCIFGYYLLNRVKIKPVIRATTSVFGFSTYKAYTVKYYTKKFNPIKKWCLSDESMDKIYNNIYLIYYDKLCVCTQGEEKKNGPLKMRHILMSDFYRKRPMNTKTAVMEKKDYQTGTRGGLFLMMQGDGANMLPEITSIERMTSPEYFFDININAKHKEYMFLIKSCTCSNTYLCESYSYERKIEKDDIEILSKYEVIDESLHAHLFQIKCISYQRNCK